MHFALLTRRAFLHASLVLTGSSLVGPPAFGVFEQQAVHAADVPDVGEVLTQYLTRWQASSEPLRVWLIVFYELCFRSNVAPAETLQFFRQAARTLELRPTDTLTVLQFLAHAFQQAIARRQTPAQLLVLDKLLHALQRTTHSKFDPEAHRAYQKYRAKKLQWLAVSRAIDRAFAEGKTDTITRLRRKRGRLVQLYTSYRTLYTQRQAHTRQRLLRRLLRRGTLRFAADTLALGDLVNKYPTKIYVERPYKEIIAAFRA